MDGKNASGLRISLLNDCTPLPPRPLPIRLPSISPSLRSRTSSYISSPVGSPPTPQLVRSNSSDSNATQSPSPMTPNFYFEGAALTNMPSPSFNQDFFHAQHHRDSSTPYPSIPHASVPHPYPSTAASQPSYLRPQQLQQPQPPQSVTVPESRAQAAAPNARSKKNSYPCPLAKQFNCPDFFTTSGHAARHAKKHTGKKDAYCPECNKAFTRKDNMEQHRRTHQSGRNAAKGSDGAVKKVKSQAKRPKPAPLQTSTPPSPHTTLIVDPMLSAEPPFAMPPAESLSSAYPDPDRYSMIPSYPSPSLYGLDALAIAASGEKRKYNP